MIAFTVNQRQIKELRAALDGSDKKVRKELATVTNKTAKKVKSRMAKELKRELNTTAKNITKTIDVVEKASRFSQASKIRAVVRLKETSRLPLVDFKARQTKTGVTYRISKREGRKRIASAFMVRMYQNNVYKRRAGEPKRIGKPLFGASPWAVFKKQNLEPVIVTYAKAEQYKQLKERIRFLKLKQAGTI